MVDVPQQEHLYPTVTPNSSLIGSLDSRRHHEEEIESSSLDTCPTITASEAYYDGVIDDAGSTRSSSRASSNEADFITEYPVSDITGTSAVLYYCKKRFLKPYLKLLALLGWRPFAEASSNRFVPWMNHAYFVLLVSILLLGCALQYCACYRLDGELPSQHFNLHNGGNATNSTRWRVLIPGASSRGGGWQWKSEAFRDDFPPDANSDQCQSPSLAAFILPDILLISAYLYFFYLMRIAENEQMEALMERAFLQTSCPTSLTNQREMLRSLRVWLAAGILWFLASSGSQLLYLATAEVRFSTFSYSFLPWIHNSLEALLILGTWLQDTVQITLITSYCLQVQLLRLSLNATVNQILQRQISLETAMKSIGESEKYVDYLNRELGISICLLFIVNLSRFASGSLWFLLSDISLIPGVVVASSVIMVILWGILFLMPVVQACRLTNTYDSVRSLGHKVRERPFGFQSSSAAELDSFLLYSSSLTLKAKVICLPVSPGFVCLILGFSAVVALTMLQVISALPSF